MPVRSGETERGLGPRGEAGAGMIKEGLDGAERQIPSQSDPSVLNIISTAELYNI